VTEKTFPADWKPFPCLIHFLESPMEGIKFLVRSERNPKSIADLSEQNSDQPVDFF